MATKFVSSSTDDSNNQYYGFYFDNIKVQAGIPVYHIYGYVKDASGNPVSNATVWVNDTTLGTSYKVTTDSNGEYNVYTYNGINGDSMSVDASSTQGSGKNSGTLSTSTEIDINLQAVPELSWFTPILLLALAGLFINRKRRR